MVRDCRRVPRPDADERADGTESTVRRRLPSVSRRSGRRLMILSQRERVEIFFERRHRNRRIKVPRSERISETWRLERFAVLPVFERRQAFQNGRNEVRFLFGVLVEERVSQELFGRRPLGRVFGEARFDHLSHVFAVLVSTAFSIEHRRIVQDGFGHCFCWLVERVWRASVGKLQRRNPERPDVR